MSADKIKEVIGEVKEAQESKRPGKDYRRLKRFGTVVLNGEERLIRALTAKEPEMRFFVATEDLYNVIMEAHTTDAGHGG